MSAPEPYIGHDDRVLDLHWVLAWAIVIGNGLSGIWAMTSNWIPKIRHRLLWVFVGLAQTAVVVQVWVGALIGMKAEFETDPFHLFYGALALLSAGFAWGYRHQLADRVYLLYGGVSLWIMGLGIRAMVIG